MGDPVADQDTLAGKGAGVGKFRIGLAADRSHHGGVEIDQICVVAGVMGIVIDAVWVMADRARRSRSRHQMPTMPAMTGRVLSERGVAQDIIPVVALITQGIGWKILGGPDLPLITLPKNRAVLRAMGPIGTSAADLGAAVAVMAVGTVDDTTGIERRLKPTRQAWHTAISPDPNHRMKGGGQRRVRRVKFKTLVRGVQNSGHDRNTLIRITMAFKTYFILKLDGDNRRSHSVHPGDPTHLAIGQRGRCRNTVRGMGVMAILALDMAGQMSNVFRRVMTMTAAIANRRHLQMMPRVLQELGGDIGAPHLSIMTIPNTVILFQQIPHQPLRPTGIMTDMTIFAAVFRHGVPLINGFYLRVPRPGIKAGGTPVPSCA